MIRGHLLASATVTSIARFASDICSSHEHVGAQRLLACDDGAAADIRVGPTLRWVPIWMSPRALLAAVDL